MKFHKNFHIVALFAAMVALNAQAAPVSPEEVRDAVSAWAAANGSAFADLGTALSAKPEYDTDGATELYYKVEMSNGGLVIASPDTDLDLVVAVLENGGGLPKGHPLASILKKDMRKRLSVISQGPSARSGAAGAIPVSLQSAASEDIPEDVKASVKAANAQWRKYGRAGSMRMQSLPAAAEIAPYIRRVVDGFEAGGRFTHWNQSSIAGELCYNYYTPSNEVCGCVATAGAAIMQFFGCADDIGERGPLDGLSATVHGKAKSWDKGTMAGAIDWSILPESFGGKSKSGLDDEGRKLLGRVTYNLGVLVGMAWAKDGPGGESGAYLSNLDDALKAYGFDFARCVDFAEGDGGTAQYFKMIYAQNWAGAPVALSISGSDGGHAVIACGYAKTPDDEDYCRVFMGWGGIGDAWYRFPEIDSYAMIDEAVTMIGYDVSKTMDPMDALGLDEAGANEIFNKIGVVPVCGRANVTDTVLKFPGVSKSAESEGLSLSFTLTAAVDSNGYFAVRIPCNTKNLEIVHEETGTSAVIAPFNSGILGNESGDRSAVEAAMPGEMVFLVLNTTVKPTVESAHKKALEDGKALLMISGAGSVRENLLVDYITYLDSNTDLSNKVVLVRVNSSDGYGDGDPSIGVFDPPSGEPGDRWWEANGYRLSYDNFIVRDDSQDLLVYTFDASDTVALTNSVDAVIRSGYDLYSRRHSGIEVSISAVDADGNALSGIDGADLPYGVYANCWTNGQPVILSAPLFCTNETLGISYECLGWSTNGADLAGSLVGGRQIELSLDESIDFFWVWKEKAYRIKASGYASGVVENAVEPAESWRVSGDRVTLAAVQSVRGFGLDYWKADGYDSMDDCFESFVNGNCLSFTVTAPLSVTAMYSRNKGKASLPGSTNTVSVSVGNPELAGLVEQGGSLSLGVNTSYDDRASIAGLTSDIVDSTGGVWKCTGYVAGGVTNSLEDGVSVRIGSSDRADIELLWELQAPAGGGSSDDPDVPEVPEDPSVVVPVPGPISITGIERSSDGKWTVTVSGAVKGCWYWLYSSDDPSALSGGGASWSASKAATSEANPQQAAENGNIVFNADAAGGSLFWRARATGTGE